MVEQGHEASSAISPKAGPTEVESPLNFNMRAAQVIGHQLAQIGDEMNSRWSRNLPNHWPQRHRWQAYVNINMLNLRAANGWILGRLWWSKIMPMVKTSWVVPQLHTQARKAVMKCFSWVYNSSDWSCRTKWFLVSLLFAAAAFTATWKIYEH